MAAEILSLRAQLTERDEPKEDADKCEGCSEPATRYDSEGTPLCDQCFDALAEDVDE